MPKSQEIQFLESSELHLAKILQQQIRIWQIIALVLTLALILAVFASPFAPRACSTSAGNEKEEKVAAKEALQANLTDRVTNNKTKTGIAKLNRHGSDSKHNCPKCVCGIESDGMVDPKNWPLYPRAIMDDDNQEAATPYILFFEDYLPASKKIRINYLNDHVLEKIKSIESYFSEIHLNVRQLFNLHMSYSHQQEESNPLYNLLAPNKITHLSIVENDLDEFFDFFPDYINQIDTLWIGKAFPRVIENLVKWLAGRIDGKQRILELVQIKKANLLERMMNEFSNATQPRNFLIHFRLNSANHEDFMLENEQTGEVLVAYRNLAFRNDSQMLLRCPKGQEERWKKEGLEKLADYRYENANQKPFLLIDLLNLSPYHYFQLN